jgi:hypothetical protein
VERYRGQVTGAILSRVDHCWKIRSRKIRTDVGKFSLQIGPSLTGIDYLKGRLGLPSLKRIYSERGLGKYISEVKRRLDTWSGSIGRYRNELQA